MAEDPLSATAMATIEADASGSGTAAQDAASDAAPAEGAEAQAAPLGFGGGVGWVPVEECEDDDSPAHARMAGVDEDSGAAAAASQETAAASPSRGLPGLALSHVPRSAHEPDDDDECVEPLASSPLVSLGTGRSGDYEVDGQGDPTSDQGDPTGGDLISRDLLHELSHDDYHEGRGGTSTPPPHIGGFETPSEPNTPSPREAAPPQYYQQNQNHDGLMCIDQWDWKTDAPEFVPGSMKGLMSSHEVAYQPQAPWAMQAPIGKGGFQGPAANSGGSDNARMAQVKANYDWQIRTKSDDLREMQQRMNQLEIETAQHRASWEIERRSLVRQIGHYRAVLERYCIPLEEAGAPSYNMEDQQGQYFPAFEPSAPSQWPSSASNPKAAAPAAAKFGAGASPGVGIDAPYLYSASVNAGAVAAVPADNGGAPASSSLDSKMRQLNNLLQEGNASTNRARQPTGSPPGESDGQGESGAQQGGKGSYTDNSIAETLKSMFPHATVRTKSTNPDDEDGEDDDREPDSPEALDHDFDGPALVPPPPRAPENVSWEDTQIVTRAVDELESSTGGNVDDRAMHALQALQHNDKLQAVSTVQQMVSEQGGQCRNLSSILQSVCRKLEKQEKQRPKHDRPNGNSQSERGSRNRDGGRRARRQDEDGGDAFDSSESEGDVAPKATGNAHSSSWKQDSEKAAPRAKGSDEVSPQKKDDKDTPSRRNRSWADIQSGDEDEGKEEVASEDIDPPQGEDPWTPQRIDSAARRGFELKRRGDQWDLKIVMSQLDPPLTEVGMERYCRWLRNRLTTVREEHGQEALWHCHGEVDFSHNHLTNQMVWMLLETLAQHEVHAALLKLFANHISQGGVLAICEFIRMNEKAEALHELHLSHNEIDDESALELLRTLKSQRPRYPPLRAAEGTGELVHAPVWLRLNHNRIRDPNTVLRAAESESIDICTAWDRQVCGTSKCVRRECALVHLYSFNIQDLPKNERQDDKNGKGDARRGKGDRHRDRDDRYGKGKDDGHRDQENERRRQGKGASRLKKEQDEAAGGWSDIPGPPSNGNHHGKDPLWDGPDESEAKRQDSWDAA